MTTNPTVNDGPAARPILIVDDDPALRRTNLVAFVFSVAFVAMGINRIASRLDQSVCLACGADLTSQPTGEHGPICPTCGAVGTADAPSIEDAGDSGPADA